MAWPHRKALWASPPLPTLSSRLLSIAPARATPLYQFSRDVLRECESSVGWALRKKYGYWRGFVDTVVARYLDCGVAESCFASLQR